VYGFADGDPINFDDPFGLCPQALAGGFGSLRCELGKFWSEAKKYVGSVVIYARVSAVPASATLEVDGEGGTAASLSASAGTSVAGVAVGVRVETADAPPGAVTVRTSAGPRVGSARVAYTETRAVTGNETIVTSRGVEVSVGTPSIAPAGAPSVSAGGTVACTGSRCPPPR
jgi:hypothetical protein